MSLTRSEIRAIERQSAIRSLPPLVDPATALRLNRRIAAMQASQTTAHHRNSAHTQPGK